MKYLILIMMTFSCLILHAQNDTASLGVDPYGKEWVVVGTGGLKVSVQDGKIIIDWAGVVKEERYVNRQFPRPTHIDNPKDGEIINSIDGQYIFYKNEWHKIEEQ